MNLLIQTRGLHTFTVGFFGFLGCREPNKPGKVEKMGNLQVTPLHREHRREGAGLLRGRGVREMSLSTEKAGSGSSFKGTLCGSESQTCAKDSHRGDVEIHSHRGTQPDGDPGKEETMRGE